MDDSKFKFQCIMCFSISEITRAQLGHQHTCSNCGQIIQLPNSSFSSGRVIADDFVIKHKLGSGAMGSVFLARQLSMDRNVALKVFFYQFKKDKNYAEEFNAEAKAAARVNHINVIQSLAFGADQDLLYMAMTYVKGETFDQLIKRHEKLDVDDGLNIIQQIAEGLHAAWTEMQLIHRDIKPANIIITEDGIAKISDFGLARRAHEINVQTISGSPAYMSPEQFAQKQLDCRSDIYSLGITLFESLTGRLPFTGNSASAVAYKHINEAIPVNNIKPALPRAIRGLIKKMCAKNPDERFQNPEELLKRIVEIRKKMALDKAAVAGVHTMSIKRHNFNEPKRDRKLKTLAQYNKESEYESKTHKQFRFLYLITGSLILTFIFLALFSLIQSSPSKMQPIKSQVDDMKIHLEVLEKSVKKGNNEMLSQIMEAFTGLGDQFNEMSGSVKSDMQREIDNLRNKVNESQKAIKAISNEMENISKQLSKNINSTLEQQKVDKPDYYKDMLWYNILKATSRGNVQVAKFLIIAEQNGPSNADALWLNQRLNELDLLGITFEHLESLAKEMGNKKLDDERTISWNASSRSFLVRHRNGRTTRVGLFESNVSDLTTLFANKWTISRISFQQAMQIFSLYTTQFASALSLGNSDEAIKAYKNKGLAEIKARGKLQSDSSLRTKQRFVDCFVATQWYEELKRELQLNNLNIKEKVLSDDTTANDGI